MRRGEERIEEERAENMRRKRKEGKVGGEGGKGNLVRGEDREQQRKREL